MTRTNTLIAAVVLAALPALAHAEKTCGQMIAEKAVQPETMAKLQTSIADMLDAHAKFMLEGKPGKAARAEARALKKLAREHRRLAASASRLAAHMKALAKLPAAPHDMAKMKADTKLQTATQEMMANEKTMADLLAKDVAGMSAKGSKK